MFNCARIKPLCQERVISFFFPSFFILPTLNFSHSFYGLRIYFTVHVKLNYLPTTYCIHSFYFLLIHVFILRLNSVHLCIRSLSFWMVAMSNPTLPTLRKGYVKSEKKRKGVPG